jgi:hypothetical protein
MAHFVRSPGNTVPVKPTAKPPRKVVRAELSFTVRLARNSFAILTSAFAAGVLILLTSLFMARRAWSSAARRKG